MPHTNTFLPVVTFCAESRPIADKHGQHVRRNRKECITNYVIIIPTPGEGGAVLKRRDLALFMITHGLHIWDWLFFKNSVTTPHSLISRRSYEGFILTSHEVHLLV